MDLDLVIINYNTREHLRRCLDSIPEKVRDTRLRVLVIDNASTDGSGSMVNSQYRNRVDLLANKENMGFARGVNQALDRFNSRYLLVLNADIEVRQGAIEALYDFMEQNPDAGMAGGKLVDDQGRLQYSCRRFYTAGAILARRTPLGRLFPNNQATQKHLMMDWDHSEARTVDWLQGGCLMMRREALAQVGGMDERFFLYFEDVDLARRMAAAGHGVYYVPQAEFVHAYRRESHHGLLSIQKLHHLVSGLRYLSKWNPRLRGVMTASCRVLMFLALLLFDLLAINAGFVLCLDLRDTFGGPLAPAATRLNTYFPILGGANILLLLTFFFMGMYRLERSVDGLGTLVQCVKAVTWVALAGSVLLFFAPAYRHGFIYSRLLLIFYYFWLMLATFSGRLLFKSIARFFWRRRLLRLRMIMVGETDPVRLLASAIRVEPATGYEVAATMPMTGDSGEELDICLAQNFKDLLQRERPDGVLFVAHRHSFRSYIPLVLESLEHSLEVRVATTLDMFPYFVHRSSEICGQMAADVTRTSFYTVKRVLKRISDVLLASLGILVCAPFLALIGALIYLHDRGPVLFLQHRVGKFGRSFKIFKLRTMRVNAEVDCQANIAEGPLTLIPNDPRVTPIGRWLRRHKIDELPQLINVLLGHMSLVGPRPPMDDEVKEYNSWQRGRLYVRPGLTGLWQIDKERKWRFNEMVELDLQYILNWSLLLDYTVMLRTIQVVLRGN